MERLELLRVLDLASSALAPESEQIIPAFSCFRLDGSNLIAHDDIIAAKILLKTDIKGVVPGHLLLKFVKACSGDDLNFVSSKKDNEVVVKCGRARLKLPVLNAVEDYPFEFPKLHGRPIFDVDDQFFDGLALCSKIVSDRGLTSWLGGVLFDLGKPVKLYSVSDTRDAICIYNFGSLGVKTEKRRQVILPISFCKLALAMHKRFGSEKAQFAVAKDYAMIYFDGHGAVFGKEIIVDQRPNIVKKVKEYVDDGADFTPLTERVREAFKRAAVVSPKDSLSSVSVSENKLRVETEASGGVLSGTVKLKGKHDDIEALVSPYQIARLMDSCTEFQILERCSVFRDGPTFTYIVANKE